MAVSCSHGRHIDRRAKSAVIEFRKAWKPDSMVHLGDFMDTAAFRSNSSEQDRGESIGEDVGMGLDFLAELEATHVLCGNHEDRLYKLQHHPNEIVATCAKSVIKEVEESVKKLKAKLYPYIYKQHIILGSAVFTHGTVFSEHACRDMAEMWAGVGRTVIFGHTHRAGMANGRTVKDSTGINVGTLAAMENMDYAKTRRATLGWGGGFAWGEYTNERTVAWVHVNGQSESWRLPIV